MYPTKNIVQEGAPVFTLGLSTWATFVNVDLDASDFERLGDAFVNSLVGNAVHRGKVGLADCQLMR